MHAISRLAIATILAVLSGRISLQLRKSGVLAGVGCALATSVIGIGGAASAQTTATATTLAVTSGGTATTSVASGSVVTLTAQVNAGTTALTTGQVNFCDATAAYCTDIHILGTAQLTNAGTATVKFRPGIGSHSYKAVFLGTNSYATSSSGASALTVTGTVGPFASNTTIGESGSWGTYTLSATVTEVGGAAPLTGTVSFLDTNNGNAVLGTGSLGGATSGLSWLSSQSPSIGEVSGVLAVGDFNGDGIPDIVEIFGSITVLLGNGDGTFRSVASGLSDYQGPSAIAVGDFNNDGIQDLALVNAYSNSVTIALGHGDGTFTAVPSSPATGNSPEGITTGDFNGDGIADLAVTNQNFSGNGSVTILLGNGDGTFTPAPVSPATGNDAYAIVSGDFNGDGKTDLAVTNQQGDNLTILLGNGDGTFTAAASPAVTSYCQDIASADFNGDGIPDLVVTCENGGLVKVLLSNGDGTFTAAPAFPSTGESPSSAVVSDFNLDGIPDIALVSNNANGSGTINVFLGHGDGTFTQSPVAPPAGYSPSVLVTADFNGDGRPDLAIPENTSTLPLVYLTEPTETASATASISLPSAGQHLVDANYGGDGNYNSSASGTTPLWGVPATTTTALTVNSGGSQVTSVTPGTVVTLSATVQVGATPVTKGQVNFCDASGTVCTDIHLLGTAALSASGAATYKFVPGAGVHSYKAVFVQDGYGLTSSSAASTLTVGPAPAPVYSDTTSITDSGQPGDYSLTATVVGYGGSATPTGSVSFLDTTFANASLTTAQLGPATAGTGFLVSQTSALTSSPNLEVTGDFNGDGIPDLAMVWSSSTDTANVSIFFGKGDGSFTAGPTAQTTVNTQYTPAYMIAGDFNGDGKADLVLLSYAYSLSTGSFVSTVTTLLGNGDGTFTASQPSNVLVQGPTGGGFIAGSMIAADFNGDGKLDLAVIGDSVSSGGVSILLGNGDGTFTAIGTNLGPNQGYGLIATGDFNGDGIPDLIVLQAFEPNSATVFLGNGDGTFTAIATSPTVADFVESIVIADVNGDGKPDLAIGYSNNVAVFLGNGDGTFTQAPGSPISGAGASLVAGDFNHDGKLDLAGMSDNFAPIELYLGAGDGTFTPTSTTDSGNQSVSNPIAIVAADFNGDGVPDFALLSRYVDTATILLAEPTETETATVNGIAPIGAGTHNVEASYSGDSNYPSSISSAIALTAGVAPPVILPAQGTITSAQSITITDATPGATIYYQAYGAIYTSGFVQYTAPIPMEGSGTLNIQAYATETGYQQSGYVNATYTLNLPSAATPVFSVAAGSYSGAQTVTITDATPGAVIYYATNGSFLNGGTQYTGAITVSTSETVAAYAIAPGYSDSAVASAEYIIDSSPSSFIYTIAGNGIQGYAGDGGPATIADLNYPPGIAVVPGGLANAGDLYIADSGNNVVRKVAAGTGIITTVAGTGIGGYSGNNGPASSAQLLYPSEVAIDTAGNLWIFDSGNNAIRIVIAATGTITAVNLNGLIPQGFVLDGSNNLYVIAGDSIWEVSGATNIPIAGNGLYGYSGDNGPATSADLAEPEGIAFDSAGNLYIADTDNDVIRKVTRTTGVITTFAGNSSREATTGNGYGFGSAGYTGDGGPATSAQLNYPNAVTFDGAGNLYIADTNNNAIRKVTASTGIITTAAGNGMACVAYSGDGGPATSAALCIPRSISIDTAGDLYIAETALSRIREVTVSGPPPTTATATPVLSVAAGTYVGSQTVSITDATPGAAIKLSINPPATITQENPSVPTELLGTGNYSGPINVTGTATIQVVAVAPGYLPSAPVTAAYTITTPPTAVITTVAGNGTSGFSGMGGPATAAEIGVPQYLAFDKSGNLYFTDTSNNVVWMVTQATGAVSVVAGNGSQGYAGNGGPAVNAELFNPAGLAVDKAGNLYIADGGNDVVREVTAGTGVITTIAGDYHSFGYPGHNGDGGPATSAYLSSPNGLAFDKAGNLYIGDEGEGLVRVISASTGIITTFAGGRSGLETNANNGDGGPAADALLTRPSALAFDSAGNLYIADSGRVRMVAASTSIITTVAGDGDAGSSGDGGQALEAEVSTQGLAVDAAGNLYFSNYESTVREVAASTGVITTVAGGNGIYGYSGDGGSATVAGLDGPLGIAFDASGSLYIADSYNYRIRKVSFPGPATAPTFSLATGTYVGAQTVTISDSIQGATIYYTTDGSTPTTASNLYSGSITVSASETLQAIAVSVGYTESAVTSAAYTINQPVTPTITWAMPAVIIYGTALGAAQLDATASVAGTFAYTPAAGTVLTAGTQTLSVTFTPTDTTDYTTAAATVALTVNKATPKVTETLSASSITTVQALTVTIAVAAVSSGQTPSGSVALSGGGYTSAAATLSNGTATINIPAGSLATGSDTLTATYTPDSTSAANYTTAIQSAAVTVTLAIGTAGATVTVNLSATTITNEQILTVNVTVAGGSGQATPTGTVTLASGSYSSQQILSSGAVSFSIAAGELSSGTDTLTASYSGDPTYASASGTATITVSPVTIAISTPSSVYPGGSATATATLTAGSNYSGTLDVTCTLTNSPSGAQSLPTCSSEPASITLAGGASGTTTLTVNTTAASGSALERHHRQNLWGLGGGGALLAVVFVFGVPSRRRRWISMFALFLVFAGAWSIGCGGSGGHSTGPSTPATTAGNYTFTVAGTDSVNSKITVSTTMTITVQ